MHAFMYLYITICMYACVHVYVCTCVSAREMRQACSCAAQVPNAIYFSTEPTSSWGHF